MNELEKIISKEYDKAYTYFTGNGTTALYLIFKMLNMKSKKILFPDITCMAPVNAAIYAGYDVVFCDVNIDDFTMNIDSLKKMILKYNVGIIVPTHIYGHLCNMKDIYKLAKENKIVVVEDAAQSLKISDYNDFAITSFGHTKLLETNIGGGAIFYKNIEFKKLFNYYSANLKKDSNSEDFKVYTEKYYKIKNSMFNEKFYLEMKKLQIESKDIFLRHFKKNNELLDVINKKDFIISERRKRVELYKNFLNKDKFQFVDNVNGELWRLSLLVKDMDRDEFINKVRKNNIDISNWYPCLHKFYNNQKDEEFKNANYISKNIVNFWVTEKCSLKNIKYDIEIINKILKLKGDKNEN